MAAAMQASLVEYNAAQSEQRRLAERFGAAAGGGGSGDGGGGSGGGGGGGGGGDFTQTAKTNHRDGGGGGDEVDEELQRVLAISYQYAGKSPPIIAAAGGNHDLRDTLKESPRPGIRPIEARLGTPLLLTPRKRRGASFHQVEQGVRDPWDVAAMTAVVAEPAADKKEAGAYTRPLFSST